MLRRYPLVRQNDQSDCGAAALATLALYHRIPVPLEQLRDLAGTDRIGTNLFGLRQAAEKLGFATKAAKAEPQALHAVPLPAIAHVTNQDGLGHFVVLYRVASRFVVVADPASGVRRMSRAEFAQLWTGFLLLAVPERATLPAAGRAAPLTPWRRLLGMLGAHRALLFEATCCALLMTLLGISTSYFVQHLVDSVLVRNELTLLNALGLGMVLIVVFRACFGALRQYLLAHVGRNIDLTMIAGYARHILHLPMKFFEMRQIGEILSRVTDAQRIRDAVSGATLTLIVDGLLVGLSTMVLWFYDPRLALLATLFQPLLVGSVSLHHPAVKRRSRRAMENSARLSAHLVEDIAGVETVKAYGVQEQRVEEDEARLVEVVQEAFGLEKLGISMSSAATLVTGMAGVAVLWYGGHRVMAGALTIGQLMFFYMLLGYMLGPLERLASVNLQLQDALVAIDRLYQVMDVEVETQTDRSVAQLDEIGSAIELRDVTFRYGCRDDVLKGVSLRVAAGSTVAVVGESGSGKSTLLKLLMRFYDPVEGQVLIDRVDIKDYDLASLRSRIGLVSQDPFVFSGTVRDNIALGRPQASMNQVVEAARSAGLHEFIAALPERYDTVIGERGANLSGGQRQRLAIARSLLCEPDLLIFDEATSHLDTATERAIQDSLRSTLVGKTVIVVAHRLSTVRHADTIYVLDQGRVAEVGTHDELLACGGQYARLWKSQVDVTDQHTLVARGGEAALRLYRGVAQGASA